MVRSLRRRSVRYVVRNGGAGAILSGPAGSPARCHFRREAAQISSARVLAQLLSDRLGQSVVVENRPGNNGNVAGELVALHAAADGYTLLFCRRARSTPSIRISMRR